MGWIVYMYYSDVLVDGCKMKVYWWESGVASVVLSSALLPRKRELFSEIVLILTLIRL